LHCLRRRHCQRGFRDDFIVLISGDTVAFKQIANNAK
jgi:hypothetical protein